MSNNIGYQGGKYDAVQEAVRVWRSNPQKANNTGYQDGNYDAVQKAADKWRSLPQNVNNSGHQDGRYDAVKEAEKIWRTNPKKYNSEGGAYYSNHRTISTYDHSRHMRKKINLVVEHWSGCSAQSVCDDIRLGIEDNFPDVKFVEVNGRYDSFEVFINGKLLYSRISQGGYPYTDEVLDAVMRVREGMKFRELERGSSTCTVL